LESPCKFLTHNRWHWLLIIYYLLPTLALLPSNRRPKIYSLSLSWGSQLFYLIKTWKESNPTIKHPTMLIHVSHISECFFCFFFRVRKKVEFWFILTHQKKQKEYIYNFILIFLWHVFYSFKSPIYVTEIDDDPFISWPPSLFFLRNFFMVSEWVIEWVSWFFQPTSKEVTINMMTWSFLSISLCLRFYEMIQPISWFFSSTQPNHLNRNWESWFYFIFHMCVCVYVIDSMPYMIHQISWFIRVHDFCNEFPMIELGFKKTMVKLDLISKCVCVCVS
jgi:hypothetical protein